MIWVLAGGMSLATSTHLAAYIKSIFESSISTVQTEFASLGGSAECTADLLSGGCRFDPCWLGNILLWRFDHEIFSMVILSLPLIQEGQLSVSDERMCTILVNHLED